MLNEYKSSFDAWLKGDVGADKASTPHTTIVRVRVSIEEKMYLKKVSRLRRWSISNLVRTLLFDVYKRELDGKSDDLANKILNSRAYAFDGRRNDFVHIRFTYKEKAALDILAKKNHQSLSQLIRWVALQVYLDDAFVEL